MRRFLPSLLTLSLAALLTVPALADSKSLESGSMSGMTMTTSAPKMVRCSAGQTYVKGYKKKNGGQVKGYCRGGKSASAKSSESTKPAQ